MKHRLYLALFTIAVGIVLTFRPLFTEDDFGQSLASCIVGILIWLAGGCWFSCEQDRIQREKRRQELLRELYLKEQLEEQEAQKLIDEYVKLLK